MFSFKNNIKKSTLSLKVIVVCLLLSGSLVSPGFANGNCYVVENGVLINDGTGYVGVCTGDIVIGDTVTSIAASAFIDNPDLTSVTIGDTVTSIGASAFSRNTALTFVTIGDSVTSIGASAFFRNSFLTSVIIGNSVTIIGANAFKDIPNLESVRFLGNAPTVETDAFLLAEIDPGNGEASFRRIADAYVG